MFEFLICEMKDLNILKEDIMCVRSVRFKVNKALLVFKFVLGCVC